MSDIDLQLDWSNPTSASRIRGSNPLGAKYLRINDLGKQGCRTNNIFNNKSIVFREYPLAFAPKFTGPIRTGVLA
jgi:hypothetical protein